MYRNFFALLVQHLWWSTFPIGFYPSPHRGYPPFAPHVSVLHTRQIAARKGWVYKTSTVRTPILTTLWVPHPLRPTSLSYIPLDRLRPQRVGLQISNPHVRTEYKIPPCQRTAPPRRGWFLSFQPRAEGRNWMTHRSSPSIFSEVTVHCRRYVASPGHENPSNPTLACARMGIRWIFYF
jgi:hypothetical protein